MAAWGRDQAHHRCLRSWCSGLAGADGSYRMRSEAHSMMCGPQVPGCPPQRLSRLGAHIMKYSHIDWVEFGRSAAGYAIHDGRIRLLVLPCQAGLGDCQTAMQAPVRLAESGLAPLRSIQAVGHLVLSVRGHYGAAGRQFNPSSGMPHSLVVGTLVARRTAPGVAGRVAVLLAWRIARVSCEAWATDHAGATSLFSLPLASRNPPEDMSASARYGR